MTGMGKSDEAMGSRERLQEFTTDTRGSTGKNDDRASCGRWGTRRAIRGRCGVGGKELAKQLKEPDDVETEEVIDCRAED